MGWNPMSWITSVREHPLTTKLTTLAETFRTRPRFWLGAALVASLACIGLGIGLSLAFRNDTISSELAEVAPPTVVEEAPEPSSPAVSPQEPEQPVEFAQENATVPDPQAPPVDLPQAGQPAGQAVTPSVSPAPVEPPQSDSTPTAPPGQQFVFEPSDPSATPPVAQEPADTNGSTQVPQLPELPAGTAQPAEFTQATPAAEPADPAPELPAGAAFQQAPPGSMVEPSAAPADQELPLREPSDGVQMPLETEPGEPQPEGGFPGGEPSTAMPQPAPQQELPPSDDVPAPQAPVASPSEDQQSGLPSESASGVVPAGAEAPTELDRTDPFGPVTPGEPSPPDMTGSPAPEQAPGPPSQPPTEEALPSVVNRDDAEPAASASEGPDTLPAGSGQTPPQPGSQEIGHRAEPSTGGTAAAGITAQNASPPTGADRPGGGALPDRSEPDLAPDVLRQAPQRIDSAVTVDIAGPEELYLGQPCKYTLTVTNQSDATVSGIQLIARVFGNARQIEATPQARQQGKLLVWDVGTLEAGASRRVEVTFVPAEEGDVGVAARVVVAAQVARRTRVTQPKLAIVKVAPKQVEVGETIRFLITVSNPGTGTARNVVIRDVMPEALQHPAGTDLEYDVGDLGPGETRDIPLEAVATRAGRFTNRVTAHADGGLKASAEATVLVTQASLAITKTGPDRRYLGSSVAFRITVRNTGTAPARNVVLRDTLPEGLRLAATPETVRWDASTRTLTWQLGVIEPGGARTVTVACLAVRPGEHCNRAVVTAAGGLNAAAEHCVTIVAVPALLLEVVDTDDPVEVGAETTYEVRLVNQGTKPIAGVRLVIEVPEGMEFVAAEAPAGFRIDEGQIIFDSLPAIAPKANAAFYIRMRGVTPGDKRLRVRVESGPFGVSVLEEESTRVYDGG